ncbi:MAG: hypothetical protein CMP97_06030, partial [Gammaproteobacteria bacterium]|nr:hypothetical protein [Gammaproteobacteria bacterium]
PEALGSYRWPISTDNVQAQAFFDQGMQLRWAYNMPESIASMVKARELDPACAMCFWGEAFSRGSFLNGGMSAQQAAPARNAIPQGGGPQKRGGAQGAGLFRGAPPSTGPCPPNSPPPLESLSVRLTRSKTVCQPWSER